MSDREFWAQVYIKYIKLGYAHEAAVRSATEALVALQLKFGRREEKPQ